MEEVVQSYVKSGKFMGSVLVARGDDVLMSKGYGMADLDGKIGNDASTKFRLGSLTKQFTAASILLLEERGKLKVEDPVKKFLPDAPAAWDKITIFHLLTHTSGIPNFTSFPEYRGSEALPTTPEKLVARFRDKPLDFEPGTEWRYSNSGYVLLGYLLERITGQKYADFLQANIFSPLGMKDSGYDSNTADIPHRAIGYELGRNGPVKAGYIDMSIPFLRRRSVFDDGGSVEMGTGSFWRQRWCPPLRWEKNDDPIPAKLRLWIGDGGKQGRP